MVGRFYQERHTMLSPPFCVLLVDMLLHEPLFVYPSFTDMTPLSMHTPAYILAAPRI